MARLRKRSAEQDTMPTAPTKRQHIEHRSSDLLAASTESQQMLALGALLEKPGNEDRESQKLHVKVAADKKKLRALIEQRTRRIEITDTKRRDEFASLITASLTGPGRTVKSNVLSYAGTNIAMNTAYTSITNVLSASDKLIDEYTRIDSLGTAMGNGYEKSLAQRWNREVRETEQALRLGARTAQRKVKKMLGAIAGEDKNGEVDTEHVEDDAKTKEDRIDDSKFALQKSLSYAERGVKRMVKGLPEEQV